MLSKFEYFPCEIFREEKPEWVENILFELNNSEDRNSAGLRNNDLYQSEDLGPFSGVVEAKNYFLTQAVTILAGQGYDVDRYKYKINSWGQKLYTGAQQIAHVHANTQITALYFLRTPLNGAFPAFEDPRPAKKMSELFPRDLNEGQINCATQEIHFNNVLPGTVLYFNSWVPHKIMPNSATDPTCFLHMTIKADENL